MLKETKSSDVPSYDKLRLQTCQVNDFHLGRESIKIPIFSAIRNSHARKQKQAAQSGIKKLNLLPAKVPCNRSEAQADFNKDKYYDRSLLLRGPIKTQQQTSASQDVVLYRKMSLPIRMNGNSNHSISIINQIRPKARLQQKHRRNTSQQKQYILPSLNLNFKMSKPRQKRISNQKSNQNNENWQRNDRRAQQSYDRKKTKQRLKSCYQPEDSMNFNFNFPLSRRPSSRIKTEVQTQNQYILEKLLTVKPSKDLTRHFLESRFERHRYYQQIRQKKDYDTKRKTLQNSAIKRSKSINDADYNTKK